jgi:hypothetical protein
VKKDAVRTILRNAAAYLALTDDGLMTGTLPFPFAMKTIRLGYWKSLLSAAIHNCHNAHIVMAILFKQHEQETTDG